MKPDPVVLEKIRQDFRALSQTDKIGEMQTCLYLKGYNVPVTGRLDNRTQAALASFKPGSHAVQGASDTELYVELWSSLGENMEQVSNRREMLARALEGSSSMEAVAAAPAKKAPAKAADKAAPAKVANQQEDGKAAPKKAEPKKAATGPAAVARNTDQVTPAKKEAAVPAKQQDARDDIARVVHSQPVLGSKNSAEALVNERRMAE